MTTFWSSILTAQFRSTDPVPLSSRQYQWLRAWPLILLCVIASGIWILPNYFPQINFDLRSASVACIIALAVSFIFVRQPRQAMKKSLVQASIGGFLVLAGPIAGSFVDAKGLSAGALTIALSLTPVVIAVATPALTNEELPANHLWPGLLAATALLLAIPAPSLHDVRTDAALLLAPLLTGVGCVLYKRSGAPTAWKAVGSFAIAAVIFASAATAYLWMQHDTAPLSFSAAGIEAVLFLLALFALQRLSAMQYSARYALVPLLLLLQGPALLWPPTVNYRNSLCGVMLLFATIALLRTQAEENVSEESLEGNEVQR
jgi:drug/metabolite transporter (DMT)-like permease